MTTIECKPVTGNGNLFTLTISVGVGVGNTESTHIFSNVPKAELAKIVHALAGTIQANTPQRTTIDNWMMSLTTPHP